jgi:hypothetical protein
MTPHSLQADEEFLRQEYFRLQETVEKFDEKALTIKAWSVTLSMAGIGAAFLHKLPVLLFLSGLASLLFWLIEASWKTFQQAYYPRIKEIESLMSGEVVKHPTSPFIARSWSDAWHLGRRDRLMLRILFWPHVLLPHALVSVVGIASWVLNFKLHFIVRTSAAGG